MTKKSNTAVGLLSAVIVCLAVFIISQTQTLLKSRQQEASVILSTPSGSSIPADSGVNREVYAIVQSNNAWPQAIPAMPGPNTELLSSGLTSRLNLSGISRGQYFSIRSEGYLVIPTTGSYRFSLLSLNGSKLWIDDQLVVDNDGVVTARAPKYSAPKTLQAGAHQIKVEYFNLTSSKTLGVYWTGPGISNRQEIPASALFHEVTAPPIISGCTDPAAINYNSTATVNDGSCTYPNGGTTLTATITAPTEGETLPMGSTYTGLDVHTSQPATCKWSYNDVAYSQMTGAMPQSGGQNNYSGSIGGLSNGGTYTFYVRCQDASGNAMTTSVSRTIHVAGTTPPPPPPGDTTPPTATITAPTAGQVLAAGTTSTNLTVTTNENATCRWGASDTTYTNMTQTFTGGGSTNHSYSLLGLADGQSYTRYVRCQDTAGNAMTSSQSRTFSVAAGQLDTTPPTATINAPGSSEVLAMGTTSTTLSVSTNEAATCKYSTSSSATYSTMTSTMSGAGTMSHTANITGLTNGTAYTYYVRCQDAALNAMTTSASVSFSVSNTTPTNGVTYYASPTGTGNGTSSSPFKIANFWAVAQPGSTLLLMDGTYTGVNSMIDPPDGLSGTSGNPITVRALHDGLATIDGQSVNKTVNLDNNDWFVLEGFNAHHSAGKVVAVTYSSHVIVRRVVGWTATGSTDKNIFGTDHSDYVLFEDNAGFGQGVRKVFSNSQQGNNATYRRNFGIWNGFPGDQQIGPKKVFAMSYNSYNGIAENNIATVDTSTGPGGVGMGSSGNLVDYPTPTVTGSYSNYEVQQPDGMFSNDGFDITPDVANAKVLGNIAYLKPDQRYWNTTTKFWAAPLAGSVKGLIYDNNVSIIEPGNAEHNLYWNTNLESTGYANQAKNLTLIGGEGVHIASDWVQSNNYSSSSCTNLIANGGNAVNNLGNFSGGATIMKRYQDGVLTTTDLWPWPMNQRIIDAMTAAGFPSNKVIDVTATIMGLCGATVPATPTLSQIASVGTQWLNATGSARTALESQLSAWTTNIDAAIDLIKPHGYITQPKGEIFNQHFTLPKLVARYPAWTDPNGSGTWTPEFNMVVPQSYNPNTPIGILFTLHWGGSWEQQEMDWPDTPDPNDSYISEWVLDGEENGSARSYVRAESDTSKFITIAPVAPFGKMLPNYATVPAINGHASRWDVPSADQYLMDIITEVAQKYNVDYNKIVVEGNSMGGYGAYHMAFRLNDRLEAVVANGGAWRYGSWADLTDLPVYTIHGTNDAYFQSTGSCRGHRTAVEFVRRAHQLMGANNPYDTLTEYPEIPGHGWEAGANSQNAGAIAWRNFINGQTGIVNSYNRDPYRNHVIARNPWLTYNGNGNFNTTWVEDPSPNTMWLSINSYGTGTVPYDYAVPSGDGECSSQSAWNNWTLNTGTENINAGRAEATIVGNTVNVTTTNVTNLSVWLHPNMVDFSQPINVKINGVNNSRTCSPSLLTALKSYERREDWKMIYTCELNFPNL